MNFYRQGSSQRAMYVPRTLILTTGVDPEGKWFLNNVVFIDRGRARAKSSAASMKIVSKTSCFFLCQIKLHLQERCFYRQGSSQRARNRLAFEPFRQNRLFGCPIKFEIQNIKQKNNYIHSTFWSMGMCSFIFGQLQGLHWKISFSFELL